MNRLEGEINNKILEIKNIGKNGVSYLQMTNEDFGDEESTNVSVKRI